MLLEKGAYPIGQRILNDIYTAAQQQSEEDIWWLTLDRVARVSSKFKPWGVRAHNISTELLQDSKILLCIEELCGMK